MNGSPGRTAEDDLKSPCPCPYCDSDRGTSCGRHRLVHRPRVSTYLDSETAKLSSPCLFLWTAWWKHVTMCKLGAHVRAQVPESCDEKKKLWFDIYSPSSVTFFRSALRMQGVYRLAGIPHCPSYHLGWSIVRLHF